MISKEEDYWNEFYNQMKQRERLSIKRFSPLEIEFSNGEIISTTKDQPFDQDLIETILEYDN